MQLPKDQQMHGMQDLEQVVRTWDDGSGDFESLDDVHPLAVQGGFDIDGRRYMSACMFWLVETSDSH